MLIAKETGKAPVFWGTGKPRREALFSEDCAEALIYLMQNYDKPEIINVGIGYDHSIKEYVEDNYPESNMKKELDLMGYVLEDLLDNEKLQKFLKVLEEKYPNNVV